MNIDLSLKRGFAAEINQGGNSSQAVVELEQCIRRLQGTLVSKGLKSAPTEFLVSGIPDEVTAVAAVEQLMTCQAVSGADMKPAVQLPSAP